MQKLILSAEVLIRPQLSSENNTFNILLWFSFLIPGKNTYLCRQILYNSKFCTYGKGNNTGRQFRRKHQGA